MNQPISYANSDKMIAKNIIGNRQIKGVGEPIYATNPKTGEIIEPAFFAIDDKSLHKALELSWEAYLQYRLIPNKKRAQFLTAIANNLEQSRALMVERTMLETALPEVRLNGELSRTINQLNMFAELLQTNDYLDVRIDQALPQRNPPRADIRYYKLPLGPVAIFGASNFPFAFSVAGGDTASALASGCPVIVKAHLAHLGASDLAAQAIAKAVQETDMPDGVFSIVYGQGNELGQKIVAHPNIRAVGFTGSRQGGLALMKTAFERDVPIPVYAEMSSINPIIILPNKLQQDGETIASTLIQSMMMGVGQFCTSPGLIFVLKEQADSFIAKAKSELEAVVGTTMLTPNIAEHFAQKTSELAKSLTVLAKGKTSQDKNTCTPHLFLASYQDFIQNPKITEEVFGSSAVIITCDSTQDIIHAINQLEGQLTASIFANDDDQNDALKAIFHALEQKVGRIIYNAFGTGVEVCSAMVHGGPFPSTSDGRSTSVGTAAIERFLRPIAYQDIPAFLLPDAVK